MVEVLFCDSHLLVLNKPQGLLTQPNQSQDPSLEEWGKAWVKEHFKKPGNVFLEAIHRLDRPVSGCVIFARTSKALSRLQASLRAGEFQKNYIALVEGEIEQEEGVLEHYLQKRAFRAHIVHAQTQDAKKCLLKYRVLKRLKKKTLVHVSLMTGRYHQIRAQFSAEGHPVLGDAKYGSTENPSAIYLHHERITFFHPISKERVTFSAPTPKEWPLLN